MALLLVLVGMPAGVERIFHFCKPKHFFGQRFLGAIFGLVFLAHCSSSEEEFLKQHFAENLAYQGKPPAHFTDLEKGLGPEHCSHCHQEQFQAWRHSLHAKSTGEQVFWELSQLKASEAKACLRCHSPLPEIKNRILKNSNDELGFDFFPEKSEEQGLFCAGCHVRNHVRYGPKPNKDTIHNSSNTNFKSPHNGFQARQEFSNSLFCKNCHESPDNGIRLAGKKRMETYTEWKQSPFQNQSCQSCHMPNREHSWKGIHDKEFVLSALEFAFLKETKGKEYRFQASIVSKRVGHRFPSYLVPLVKVQILGKTKQGRNQILQEDFLGWQVTTNLEKEVFDSRLDPGEKRVWELLLSEKESKEFLEILFQVIVYPDEFYIRKWDSDITSLPQSIQNQRAFSQGQRAIESKRNSHYLLWERSIPF